MVSYREESCATHHTGSTSWCEFSLLGDGFYTALYFLVSLVSFIRTKSLLKYPENNRLG